MNTQSNSIECPNCGHKIDVNDILQHQISEGLKNELNKNEALYKAQQQDLEKEKQVLIEEKQKQDDSFAKRIETEKEIIQNKLKQQFEDEQSASLQSLQQELKQKSEQLKDFNEAKANIERLKREKDELQEKIALEKEKEFSEKLKEEKLKIQKQIEDSTTLKIEEFKSEQSVSLLSLQKELKEKSVQLKEFNEAKANIERLKREKDELQEKIALEKEKEFSEKLKEEKLKIQKQVDDTTTLKIEEFKNEQSASLQSLQQELKEKSEQLKEFNEAKANIERLKREKDELQEKIVLEKEKEFSEKLKEEKLKIQKQVDESSSLKIRELQMQLEKQKELAEEMQRKAEQGSMQLQGEAQELAIEEWLKNNFPLDTIDEVKKGERGADCLQIVHTRTRQNCGSIYYESKRTKNFQTAWIEKFKKDIRDKNAILGVLVTEVMPSDMERMGLKEGIWICTFDEFKGLCTVLRESVIKLSEVKASQENKGDKMEMLYSYLTSNEFKLQIESIVDGFSQMQKDLDAEKRAMASIWKKREKQLEKVLENTTSMHGSIRGIAGSAIQSVALLELDSSE